MSDFSAQDFTVGSEAGARPLQCIACKRTFRQMNAYNTHVGSCRREKKRGASALELAKESFRRKKLRLSTGNPPVAQEQLIPEPQHGTDLQLAVAAGPSQEVSSILSSLL